MTYFCFLLYRVQNAEVLCLGLVSVAVFMLVLPLFRATAGILLQMAPPSISTTALSKCLRQVIIFSWANVLCPLLLGVLTPTLKFVWNTDTYALTESERLTVYNTTVINEINTFFFQFQYISTWLKTHLLFKFPDNAGVLQISHLSCSQILI